MISAPSKFRVGSTYALYYAGQYVLLGIQLPFLAGWLDERGFTTPEIGAINAIALIARLVFGPGIAFWADHQRDERYPLRVVTALFAVAGLILPFATDKLLIAICSIGVITTFGLLVPLTDTAVLRADRNGYVHYGQIRGFGSIAFLSTTVLGGALLTKAGMDASVWVMAIAANFAFVMALVLPKGAGSRGGETPMSWREAPKLVGHRVFLALLIASGFTQGAHGVYFTFSYLRWEELGLSAFVIGLLWAWAVVAETVLLLFGRRVVRHFSPVLLVGVGAIAAVVRWSFTALEPNLWFLFALQTMHALTFAASYLGSLEFLDRAAPTRLVTTGMTLVSATGVGAMTGVGAFVGGLVWDSMGPGWAYYTMALMGVVAFGATVLLARWWDGGKLF